jgi:hypothetical protein
MATLQAANLVLRFLLELCALAALGYWGFQTGQNTFWKIVLGIGAPLVTALVWGTFLSPRARMPAPEPWFLLLQVLIFGLAAWSLAATGQRTLAWVFGLAVAIHLVLLYAWGQSGATDLS